METENSLEVVSKTSDTNIGREWNSCYGRQKITSRDVHLTGDIYDVVTLGYEGAVRRYSVDRIEDVIKTDAHRLTPEYQEQQLKREQQAKDEEERRAMADKEARQFEESIMVFTNAMNYSAMQAGLAKKVLTKFVRHKDQILRMAELIDRLVTKGRTPEESEENRIKPMTSRAFSRADNREQDDHERKSKLAGNKKAYNLVSADGYCLPLGAYEYAYAKYLHALKAEANIESAGCF